MIVRTIIDSQCDTQKRLEVAVLLIRKLEEERQELVKIKKNAEKLLRGRDFTKCKECKLWFDKFSIIKCNCKRNFCYESTLKKCICQKCEKRFYFLQQ